MDWFKRYGIPGAYCMGLTFVWLAILYPCRIDLCNETSLKIVGGVFAGGFLPFGYLMCNIGNSWYFLMCSLSNRYVRHAVARNIDDTNQTQEGNESFDIEWWANWVKDRMQNTNTAFINFLVNKSEEKEIVLGPCSVLATVSRKDFGLEGDKFVQEWIRKRHDIVVMNQAIMAGTIVCSIGAVCLHFLPGWSWQSHEPQYWKWTLIAVVCLQFIIWYVTSVVRIGIDIVIAGMFYLRSRSN